MHYSYSVKYFTEYIRVQLLWHRTSVYAVLCEQLPISRINFEDLHTHFQTTFSTKAVHMLARCSSTGTNNVQMPKYSPSNYFSLGSGDGGTYIPAVSLICYIHVLYMYLLLQIFALLLNQFYANEAPGILKYKK